MFRVCARMNEQSCWGRGDRIASMGILILERSLRRTALSVKRHIFFECAIRWEEELHEMV